MSNLLIVVVQRGGHTINAPATNDEYGRIYADIGDVRIRFDRNDYAKVEKQKYFDEWTTCADTAIVAVYNKNLDELPDV